MNTIKVLYEKNIERNKNKYFNRFIFFFFQKVMLDKMKNCFNFKSYFFLF